MTILYNKDLKPLAVVPDHWLRGEPYCSPDIVWNVAPPQKMPKRPPSDMKPVAMTEPASYFSYKFVRVSGSGDYWIRVLVGGLDCLIDHEEVATWPRARQR
jgi:hypothetical protein